MGNFLRTFLRNEAGTAMVQYGVLVGTVGLVAAVALEPIGAGLTAVFDEIRDVFQSANHKIIAG